MAVVTPGAVQDAELIASWFEVKLDNGITGLFSDFSGLAIEVEIVDNTLTSKDTVNRKRPGTAKYGEITLKRTLSADKAFWQWAKSISDGKKDFRTNGAVMLYDIGQNVIGNWKFTNAWPSKWSASDLDVGTDDLMQEEVTLQIEMLERVM